MPFIMTRVHGNAVVAEHPADGYLIQVQGRPYTDVVGLPFGWGKTFRGVTGKDNWFHIPLPTVVHLESTPLFLDQFYVFFTCELRDGGREFTSGVDEIHLYDGSAKIWEQRSAEMMAGDWSNPREVIDHTGAVGPISNTWYPRQRSGPLAGQRFTIYTGLGISVHVGWLLEGNVTFHSAGANWVDSVS